MAMPEEHHRELPQKHRHFHRDSDVGDSYTNPFGSGGEGGEEEAALLVSNSIPHLSALTVTETESNRTLSPNPSSEDFFGSIVRSLPSEEVPVTSPEHPLSPIMRVIGEGDKTYQNPFDPQSTEQPFLLLSQSQALPAGRDFIQLQQPKLQHPSPLGNKRDYEHFHNYEDIGDIYGNPFGQPTNTNLLKSNSTVVKERNSGNPTTKCPAVIGNEEDILLSLDYTFSPIQNPKIEPSTSPSPPPPISPRTTDLRTTTSSPRPPPKHAPSRSCQTPPPPRPRLSPKKNSSPPPLKSSPKKNSPPLRLPPKKTSPPPPLKGSPKKNSPPPPLKGSPKKNSPPPRLPPKKTSPPPK